MTGNGWMSRSVIVLASLLLLAGPAVGQGLLFGGGEEKVQFTLEIVPNTARRGETVEARVTAVIDKGWHIYSLTPVEAEFGPQPTEITIQADGLDPLGEFTQPKPLRKMDLAFEMIVESFEDEVTFTQKLRVTDAAALGEHDATARIRFMVCTDRTCLPPTTVEATATFTVEEGTARPEYVTAQMPVTPDGGQSPQATRAGDGTTSALNAARARGFLPYLAFAISMGFLALLTPCVFPMIPITVSFFTKKEGLTRLQGLTQASVYAGGIVVMFTGLGIVLALLFGAAAIQNVASNVWVNLFVALVFIMFALNLFGAFEIRVPHQVLSFFGSRTTQGVGTAGTLLMGLTFSLTSFTCTVPFVGTVLVAATQGDLAWALTGMLGFSAAFASPFFLLALFPQLLARLPKAGGWMNSVKVTLGFLELAAAMKFLSNIDLLFDWGILPRELFLAGWIAITLIAGYYLLGKIQLPHDPPVERIGVTRLILSLFFFATGLYLITGLFGQPLGEIDAFLPPYAMSDRVVGTSVGNGAPTLATSTENWIEDYDEGLVKARQLGRPIFIDFTGVTCTNCRWMEKNIFARPDVAEIMGRFVLVRLWTDKPNEHSRANQEFQRRRFGTVALPFYALMTPGDEVIATFDGLTRDPEVFKSFLRNGLSKYAALANAGQLGE